MEMGLHLENKLTKNITGHPQEKDQIHEGKQSKQDNQENTSIQEDYVGHRESAFRKVQGEQGRFSSSKNANEVFETLHGDVSGQVNGGSEFHIPISIGMEPSLVRNSGPFSGTGNREEESAGQTEGNTGVYKEFRNILGAVNSQYPEKK